MIDRKGRPLRFLLSGGQCFDGKAAVPLNKPLAVFLLLQLNATGQRIRLLGAFGTGQIDCFLFYNPVGVIYPAVPPGARCRAKKRNTAHTMHLAENTNLFSTENRRADTKVQMFCHRLFAQRCGGAGKNLHPRPR